MMRTTLDLPEDVHRAAKSMATLEGVSLGEAVARLVRRGLRPPRPTSAGKAFPCFTVSRNAKPITLDETLEAEDEL